jgi:hypothetical protein
MTQAWGDATTVGGFFVAELAVDRVDVSTGEHVGPRFTLPIDGATVAAVGDERDPDRLFRWIGSGVSPPTATRSGTRGCGWGIVKPTKLTSSPALGRSVN